MMITELLDRIHGHLVRLDHPVVELLQPGLPPDEIRAKASGLGLIFPEELVELYAWRNGIPYIEGSILGKISFFPGYHFPCIEDSSTDYRVFREDKRWDPQWFPVFANGGGDFYAVDCATGRVIDFLLDEPEQFVGHESLGTMMQTMLHCLEKEVFFVSDDGQLTADYPKWFRIAKIYNPDLKLYERY